MLRAPDKCKFSVNKRTSLLKDLSFFAVFTEFIVKLHENHKKYCTLCTLKFKKNCGMIK